MAGVFVVADGDDHVGAGLCAEPARKFREGDSADLDGATEVGVVGDGVGFLREREQRSVGDEARLALRYSLQGATDFEVGGGLAGG